MFKTQVEPRAVGEWFHCQVLDILWRHFMVYKSIDQRCQFYGESEMCGKGNFLGGWVEVFGS